MCAAPEARRAISKDPQLSASSAVQLQASARSRTRRRVNRGGESTMIGRNVLCCCLALVSAVAACVAEPEGIRRLTGSGAVGAASGGEGGVAPSALDDCEGLHVLESKCGRCHGAPNAHGAPFSFLTRD